MVRRRHGGGQWLGTGLLLLAAAACRGPAPPAETGEAQVAPGPPWLVDVTTEVGVDFVHETGATGGFHLPEIVGGGVALFDADGDGDLDLYLTSGTFLWGGAPSGARPSGRFYRHESDGTFADRTARAGLAFEGFGLGAAAGDVDDDGDIDLYLTNFGPDRLYRNRGDGTFEDATSASGMSVDGFSCSAAFCDYDQDGHLDLYVTQYARYDPGRECRNGAGEPDYCGPRAFNPVPDVLLRNRGDGTFEDVSERAGLRAAAPGAGLGVVCEDLDGDGRPDFYVANDQYANHLWINRGGGTFEERALIAGVAYNLEGRAESGMGVFAADLDGDLDLELFVTNLGGETNTLYRNLGGGMFEDATGAAGLAESSLPYTGFGTAAPDLDLDGDLDLLVANGRVFRGRPSEAAAVPAPWSHFAEPDLLYLNRGDGRFDARPELAPAWTRVVEVTRAIATGDLDHDGDLDVVATHTQGPARVYRNEAPRAGHWLIVRAVEPGSGRDAIGARVSVAAGGRERLRTITASFSYLASSDPRAHFGLGAAERVERIDVRWPDGATERFDAPAVDRVVTLVRGQGSAR